MRPCSLLDSVSKNFIAFQAITKSSWSMGGSLRMILADWEWAS